MKNERSLTHLDALGDGWAGRSSRCSNKVALFNLPAIVADSNEKPMMVVTLKDRCYLRISVFESWVRSMGENSERGGGAVVPPLSFNTPLMWWCRKWIRRQTKNHPIRSRNCWLQRTYWLDHSGPLIRCLLLGSRYLRYLFFEWGA